jgi:hypothetical protein
MPSYQLRRGRDLIEAFESPVDPKDGDDVIALLKSVAKANKVDPKIAHLVCKRRGASDLVFRAK